MIVKKSMRAKLAWMVRVLARKVGADIVLIQETHFKTPKDMKEALFPYGGQLRGYSPIGTRLKGVVAYTPPDSALYGMVHNVETDLEGRWALMEIRAQEESQRLLNVYAPSSSVQAREVFFTGREGKFDGCPNLIAVGDWNYAPEATCKDMVGLWDGGTGGTAGCGGTTGCRPGLGGSFQVHIPGCGGHHLQAWK